MSNLPFTAKGSTGEVTFTGTEVLIRRTGWLGALLQFTGQGRGNKDIPVSSITAIRMEPASLFYKPFFQVIHSGDVAVRGGAEAVLHDDNAMLFSKRSTADFEHLKKLILEAVAATHLPPGTSPAAEDIPSILQKLADLKDRRVITEEEFLVKKADLLSRI